MNNRRDTPGRRRQKIEMKQKVQVIDHVYPDGKTTTKKAFVSYSPKRYRFVTHQSAYSY